MTNKTQLQTNNTNLDSLISKINAAKNVAASLPEAGSGGGGSIELCTVTITMDGPPTDEIIYYTNGSSGLMQVGIAGGNNTIEVMKNSFICTNISFNNRDPDVLIGYGPYFKLFFITADATFDIMV